MTEFAIPEDTGSGLALESDSPTPHSMKPLHPSVRTVWRISLGLTWGLITTGVAIFEIFRFLGDGSWFLPTGVTTLLLFVFTVVSVTIVPSLRYRFWRYELMADELHLQRGILNRIRTIVPLRRIQHLDVSQNVLEKEFDLGKLIVHTAGSRSSDVVLPGLHIEEAEGLRDRLKDFILEDAL